MMDGLNDNVLLRYCRSYFLMTVRVFTYSVDVISLIRSSLMNFPVSPLTLISAGYQTISSSVFLLLQSLPFGIHLDPTILASCKYFNLPYFQPVQLVYSFFQSLSSYLIVVRYFAASIDTIVILTYHTLGVTLCHQIITVLAWQITRNMSFPQLGRFFQQVTLFWDNLHRPLVFATICLHIEQTISSIVISCYQISQCLSFRTFVLPFVHIRTYSLRVIISDYLIFKPPEITLIYVFLQVWLSSFPQSLSPYLIVVRYFAASIVSILNLFTIPWELPLATTNVVQQLRPNEHTDVWMNIFISSPQLERF